MPDEQVERGVALVRELPQVMPDDAEGRLADVFDDTQRVLGVPFVNTIFRVLANDPGWLTCAWRGFARAAATPAFAAAAARLRDRAAPDAPLEGDPGAWVDAADLATIRSYTAAVHEVLPKLLLFASAAQAALEGRAERGAGGPAAAEAGAAPAGADPRFAPVRMVDPEEAEPDVAELLAEIADRHGHPAPASWFRVLARWPAVLRELWARLEPLVADPARARRREELVAAGVGEAAALALAGRLAECPAGDREELAAVVAVFGRRMVPDLLLDVASARPLLDRSA